jgi:dihydroorotate dehydrogenase/NAD-dependent dihydropyrimidine dehydrogenase PreA subunit
MADLRAEFAGLSLQHPLILASGPLSWSGRAIVRAHRAGAAAVVTKTISQTAAQSPRPHIVSLPGGVLNVERWSDLDPREWIERELPLAKDSGATVIASVGLSAKGVASLARALEAAGADALEVVSYAEDALPGMVRAAAKRVRIPVLAKVHANGRDLIGIARACAGCGAAAITAIDSVGPGLRVDLERRQPLIGAPAWWSGPAILPLALHAVAAVHRATGVPVVGTGGVGSADAAIEMLFAGASAVGLCSVPLVGGLELFAQMREAMAERLDRLGISSVRDAVGAAAEEARTDLALRFNKSACSGCGACVRICPYEARRTPDAVEATCRGCGLCVSVCASGALGWEGRQA